MLQSEFETHTDIFPDVLLYEAAEHEYNEGSWESKAGFCHDFKFNVDGIAQKCQRIANERWIAVNEEASRLRSEAKPLADQCEKLRAEKARLEDENENLLTEIRQLSKRVDELNKQITELPTATLEVTEPEITVQELHTAICKAETMMLAEFSRKDVGTAHIGFDYLLKALEVE